MKINSLSHSRFVIFKRKLTPKEESDYIDVLKKAKEKVSHEQNGKSVLIIHAPSLPQKKENNTGVGNIASKDGIMFIDFAKKYWGINEIQLLPMGQYHRVMSTFPIYSGTSMNFGNHVIDVKQFVSENDFNKIVNTNKDNKAVNYYNVVLNDSIQEKVLKNLHENIPENLKSEFESYKKNIPQIIQRKSLYRALREIYNTNDYKYWGGYDADLFNENIVSGDMRKKRISEIEKLKSDTIDFFCFKEFLAEKSFKQAKKQLNDMGIKLSGDMLCGFSYDEVWANPQAFIPNMRNRWDLPVLNFGTEEAEKVFREKIKFYAQNFDGFRVDAAWQYVTPNYTDINTKQLYRKNYGDKYLKIIDDEVKKVKGKDYDLKNISYEFTADNSDFSQFQENGELKPFLKKTNENLYF